MLKRDANGSTVCKPTPPKVGFPPSSKPIDIVMTQLDDMD
jgi:hypothetical protein